MIAALPTAKAASDDRRWGAKYIPNYTVTSQDGKSFKFYDDLIKGKKFVINFVYTDCPDICGLTTSRMALVYKRLGDRVGRDVFIYSISLDPAKDTPEKMKAYADAFGAGPGWLFLTGDPKDIHTIRYKLGERSRSLSEHRAIVMLGNDETGEWSRSSMMANLGRLTRQILELDPEWLQKRQMAKQKRIKPSSLRLTSKPGQALFLKACSSCHSVGGGDRVGPDLLGVVTRRDHNWLVEFMMTPGIMRGKKDPIATRLNAAYPGVIMPYLGLSKNDAEDLIAYLENRTREFDENNNQRASSQKNDEGHSHVHDDSHSHATSGGG